MKALIFSWNSFSLIVRWLNLGLSTGVRAQHQPINTNLRERERERERMMGRGNRVYEYRPLNSHAMSVTLFAHSASTQFIFTLM